MPIYPFQCPECKQKVDYLSVIYDGGKSANLKCPKCQILMKRIFTSFAIHGLGYDTGYRPGVDDPVKEVKHDMKNLEQSMVETHNLKAYREKKKALEYFAEANEDIL